MAWCASVQVYRNGDTIETLTRDPDGFTSAELRLADNYCKTLLATGVWQHPSNPTLTVTVTPTQDATVTAHAYAYFTDRDRARDWLDEQQQVLTEAVAACTPMSGIIDYRPPADHPFNEIGFDCNSIFTA